jgi:hypothetical protein
MSKPPAPRAPGYRFKDGKLMIFREDEVMLIQGWDQPSAARKSDAYWEPFIPEFRLVAPYRRAAKTAPKKVAEKPLPPSATGQLDFDLGGVDVAAKPTPAKPVIVTPSALNEQRRRAFDAFRFSLPKEVARVIEGFRSHQWNLITLLAHDKAVMDLATTNPVLAYAVADWFGDYPRSRLNFGGMPQCKLLKLLKLPDTPALVKLFRKIPPESIDRRLWQLLLTALRQPDGASSKLLAHVPAINLGVMELILTPHIRPALTPTLLEEVAADPKEKYRGAVAAMLRDTVAMKDELADERPLAAVTSVARLQDLHAKVSADFQKLETLRKPMARCPCRRSRASRAGSSGFKLRQSWWRKGGIRKTVSPLTPPAWWPGVVIFTRFSTRAAPPCASDVFPMATGASPNSKRHAIKTWTPPPASS